MELRTRVTRLAASVAHRHLRLHATQRAMAVTALLVVGAASLTATVLGNLHALPGETTIPWWGIAVAYFLLGVFVAHITVRNQAYTLTLSEVAMVLGLVAATPSALIAGGLAGTAVSLIAVRRQQPLKVVFNLATFLLEANLALVVMHSLLHGNGTGSGVGWLATMAGTVVASAAGQAMVWIIVLASAGALPIRQILRTLAFTLVAAILNTVVALSGLHAVTHDPQLAALFLIPLVVLAGAYRSYVTEHHRHGQVRQLYEASGALHRSRGVDASITTMLGRARDMLNADVAELVLLSTAASVGSRRFTLGPGQDGVVVSGVDDAGVGDLPAGDKPVLLLGADGHAGPLSARGWRNGIAVSIPVDGAARGVLLVANRRDAVSSFGRADLELLEAFAGPASVSLANGRLEAELEHQAFHDPLTGLANRALLARRIQAALGSGPRGAFAILLLDVDDFKAVNDTLGHPAGDQLLIHIARRVSGCLRVGDMAARLGGDEFAVVLNAVSGVEDAVATAERILEALRRPFTFSACEVSVRASVGIVLDNPAVASVEDLLSSADIAMYRAKAHGKDHSVVFEPLMHVEVMARHQLRVDLERAVAERTLMVHYQPIIALETGDMTGAEALIRWSHPVRGMVPPDEFIPLAEESGLVVPLGRFVLDEACRQLAQWQRRDPSFRLSVNISARELLHPGIAGDVAATCARHGVDVRGLTLEVTEHVMVDDARALDALRGLRALGVRIAVDDFGTGYSSLSVLRDLPIDILKVAKPFVDRMERSEDDRAVTMSVVGLARSLRLDTVAEGIERPNQAEMLRAAGCGLGQGFLYSRAVPAAELLARLTVPIVEAPAALLSLAG